MYNDFYGFRVSPFSATPDPQFFFNNALYQEAFATLQYGVLAKKGFVVVTGEVGTGKTTLLRRLLHSLGPTVHSVFIFNTQVTFIELLRLILEDLGLQRQSEDKLSLIAALNQYLIERLEAREIVALLVDEAQNLSDEVLEGLRLLSNLETDTEKLLQIVLMGQPELEKRLAQPKLRQLKQRVTLHSRLAPLHPSEVAAYIKCRLDAAGYEGKALFVPSAITEIGKYSKGIPRLINIICDNALLVAFADSRKEVSAEAIREVAADLRLEEKTTPEPAAARASVPPRQQKDPAWLREADDVPDDIWVTHIDMDNVSAPADPPRDVPRRKRRWAGVGLKWALAAIGIAGFAAALDLRLARQSPPELPPAPVSARSDAFSPPEPEFVSRPAESEPPSAPEPRPDIRKPAPARRPPPRAETRSKPAAEKVPIRREAPEPVKVAEPENQRKKLEAEVQAALQNRAIDGVSVSIVEDTVYLDGRVASIRQKVMAERAARSVTEVKRVRNRLDVARS